MRLNPAHAFPYSNLAYAFRGAGRYAESKRTAEKAVELGIETRADAPPALSAREFSTETPPRRSGSWTGRGPGRAAST